MDISVLPNNNHPEKFLQLDIRMLPAAHSVFQVGAVMSSQKQWQNRIYSQVCTIVLTVGLPGKCPVRPIASPALVTSNIKRNPLYIEVKSVDAGDNETSHPSWTVKDYTHTNHGNLSDYLQDKTPKDLDFWLEELYTPGFDSLLKRKEAEERRKICKILSSITVSVFALIIIIIVLVIVLQKNT
uniref:Membrane integral NOTCH2 associated receptor 2 n=1 Tax=Amphilophus citrinellus TaxID=61819 RepID=A0A3Q0RNG6_AMPCI